MSMSFGRYSPKVFHSVVPVWKYGFDEELNTVPPDKVLNAWLSIVFKTPNKKYIIHFMQPHFPTIDKQYKIKSPEPNEVIKLVRGGVKSCAYVKRAYLINLIYVLQMVVKMIKIAKLLGFRKIVVTSDHGDLVELGGHPYGTYVVDLCVVPWIEIDAAKVNIEQDELEKFLKIIELHRRIVHLACSLGHRTWAL